MVYITVWANAITLNVSLQTIESGTKDKIEVAVNIFLIRNGTAKMYAVISDRRAMQCNETGTREES